MFRLRSRPSPDLPYGRWAEHYHVCPLCDALTTADGDECTVCGWHGAFEHNPAIVEMAMRTLLAECPYVVRLLSPEPEPIPWWKRWMVRRRRNIDLRV